MIKLEKVNKWYGEHHVLKDVDLSVARGEVLVVCGPSGSGKSTMIRTINRLEPIEKGRILIDDADIYGKGVNLNALRQKIGFVFQQFNLVGRLPVITNVLTGLLPRVPMWRSLTRVFLRDEVRQGLDALAQVGIDDYAFQRASTLSGGQQQRAAIARTLVQNARVILADEPIASLDPESSRRVMDTLAHINRSRKVAVVVSLHQVDVALRYCPRVVALRHGKVVYDGPSADLTPAMLRDLYGSELSELLPEYAPQAQPLPGLAPLSQQAYAA